MAISTLVIGLGGTGVLAVRSLKKRYLDLDPQQRVPAAFLAIDFDRSALMVSDNDSLAELGDEDFLYLQPEAIQDLVHNLDRTIDDHPAWQKILDWFPERGTGQIPPSEVEANGAGQYRVLGRAGFFLHDEMIAAAVRGAVDRLQPEIDTSRLTRQRRIILVSSLAGGTGSGMVLDVAYLARMHESRPRVYGYFLLPEVFQEVDHGGRIFQNAYAALKELANFKDQRLSFRGNYFRIPPVDQTHGGELPLARTFLFGRVMAPGKDPVRAAIHQMAGTIPGQLNRTIQEKSLAVVSNTTVSSAHEELKRRHTHCFSTAGSSYIDLGKAQITSDVLVTEVLRTFRDEAALADTYRPTARAAFQQAILRLDAGDTESVGTASADDETTSTPGSGDGNEETKETDALARAWETRIQRAAREGADRLVEELGEKIDALTKQAGHRRPQEVDEAATSVKELHALLTTPFTEENYSANLERLKKLSRFQQVDRDLKSIVDILLLSQSSSSRASDTGELLKRKAFYDALDQRRQRLLRGFPDPDSPATERTRTDWDKLDVITRSKTRRSWFVRRVSIRIGSPEQRLEATTWARCKLLRKQLADLTFRDNLRAILRVRAGKRLERRLAAELEIINNKLTELRKPWQGIQVSQSVEEQRVRLPATVRRALVEHTRARLGSILDQVDQIVDQEEDAERRHAKLTELIRDELLQHEDLRRARYVIEGTDDGQGYERKILEALVKTRQEVFVRRTPNPSRQGFGLVLVPTGIVWPKGEAALHSFLRANAAQILDCRCEVLPYDGARIWIYYEDLFNPPAHIQNLDEYFRAYQQEPEPALFHVDRRLLQNPLFRDINTGHSTFVVTCGNDPCRENIAALPRETRICTACKRLIRSRCGNPGCSLNDLNRRDDGLAKDCPGCGHFNHAAWWKCDQHGKSDVLVPIDKPRCPRCIERHLEDPEGFPRTCISQRPDLHRSVPCPNCEDRAREHPDHEVFHIYDDLLRYYRDGVNGHDSERFSRLASRYGLPDGFRCPSCRTHLIPIHHRAEREAVPSCH